MTPQDAQTALTEELHKIAPDIDVAGIDRGADLREEFDIDSMDFLNLVSALSKRFGIPVPESDYPRLMTFSDAVSYIAEKAG